MQSSARKIILGTIVFLMTMGIAVVGYWFAGWSLLESFYMVVITIYGVGYGEVRPIEAPSLRIFTILFIVSGCTSAVFVMGGFVQMIAEGEIRKALGARRMTEGIKKLKNHVIVCGFGRVGQNLTTELRAASVPFVIVDNNRERLIEAEELGDLVYLGDATEEATLEAVGIAHAETLATVLPNDAANVFITLSARELNENVRIIARGESQSTRRKLIRSGANEVVMPAAVGAHRIAQLIKLPHQTLLTCNSDQTTRMNDELQPLGVSIEEFVVREGADLADRTIGEIEHRSERGIVVLSIRKTDEEEIRAPGPDVRISPGDVIVFIGHVSAMKRLNQFNKAKSVIYRGARID
ncbi:Voltage-gated potassium channel Kch [Thalassoglobus neptunius]|uniref:Voltage-gated potassium channel Kch n=1 Tax=Thalassoglobus neptunius TaxID=1938619 RepID=A0A5C5W8B7_9PLAN|nr:potassium channel protein [Thalassoglobus neptunius]TWT47138.1 Voltage-gated potassium channel Kch [Thalassoglobus neptunius]